MLAPGTTLGPYTIADLLGIGGMGEVYRAHDARLNREVAIKVLPPELADDRALERFRREARAVAALSHPNILAIFDVGSEKGIHYAVTELLEGETLRARLGRGSFSPQDALQLLLEIADGVAAAHARTIVHRDLKPENIFITSTGRVKVLDFGLARGASAVVDARLAFGDTEIMPTQPGVVMGTIGYLSPEQLAAHTPTPASDVFALGCILFEMVSGHVPFDRPSSAHAMVALMHDPAPRLQLTGEAMLRDVDALVQRCLAKDPADRFADAGALAAAIRAVLGGERIRVKSTFPWRLVAVAVIGLVIAITAFITLSARNRQLDHGYDLRVSDIRGDAETRRLMTLALRADAQGNRPKAQELLEEASRRGLRTAFPAAFLSSFSDAAGNTALAKKWEKEALSRLRGAPPYESLLARYLVVTGDRPRDLALARSALELRPDAWRLRLAVAHLHLQQRENDAALRELRRIDVEQPDDRRLMLVLSDRASLGDIDGAARDLRRSRLVQQPALLHYTEGRIAWSRGSTRVAQQMWLRAADEAADHNPQLEVEARELAGVAAIRLGDWAGAQRYLARASHRAKEFNLTWRQWQTLALGAYAAHRAGDFEERDEKLRAASTIFVDDHAAQGVLRLLALRLGSELWKALPAPSPESEPALAALIRAREAWFAGDAATAARELRRANGEGIEITHLREDAELLAAELGLPYTRLRPDPPYPNLIRYVAIFDLERTGGLQPAPRPTG
ncbi:MAG TPA: protein kinase [Thermoanaerobaculia bacterium]|nr:protein kinase [Thermoanaerobaculia bacterium]